MSGLDIFAWVVFVVIILAAVAVFLALAQLPGATAKARNHPQAEAINMAGWLGLLLTMGVVWVVAMIWSRTVPAGSTSKPELDELKQLRERVIELEALQLAKGE